MQSLTGCLGQKRGLVEAARGFPFGMQRHRHNRRARRYLCFRCNAAKQRSEVLRQTRATLVLELVNCLAQRAGVCAYRYDSTQPWIHHSALAAERVRFGNRGSAERAAQGWHIGELPDA